jgi:hypothetical protein
VRSVELKGGDAPLPSSLLATSAPRGRGLHSSPPSTAWGGSTRGGSVAGGRRPGSAAASTTSGRRPGTAVSRMESTSTFEDRLRRFQVCNGSASLLVPVVVATCSAFEPCSVRNMCFVRCGLMLCYYCCVLCTPAQLHDCCITTHAVVSTVLWLALRTLLLLL